MKKHFLVLIACLFVSGILSAQIPNFNFESWSNGANASPDGWKDKDSNHSGFYPVSQTTDKYKGSYAVRIESRITASDTTEGILSTIRPADGEGFGPAFPINQRYNNLKGYYKYTPENGDSAQIIVFITKTGFSGQWGNLLAWGQYNLGAAATYTPFSAGYLDSLPDFLYNDDVEIPDSAYINIAAFKSIGDSYNMPPLGNSVLIVDALNFDSFFTGVNETMDIAEEFNLYPRVNRGTFDVRFETTMDNFVTITIYTIDGKRVKSLYEDNLTKGSHTFNYNLPELNNGNYLFVVSSDRGYHTEKLIIQK